MPGGFFVKGRWSVRTDTELLLTEAEYVLYLTSLKEDMNRLILTALGDTGNLVTKKAIETRPCAAHNDQNPLRGLGHLPPEPRDADI